MRDWVRAHPSLAGGLALAAGIPAVIFVGGEFVFGIALLPQVESARLDSSPWFWIALLVVPCVLLWFVVTSVLRFGGREAIHIGLIIDLGLAVLLFVVGQSRSDGFLGGFVPVLWALAIAALLVVTLVMAGLASLGSRSSASSDDERHA